MYNDNEMNPYWPVFKNIESEFSKLMFYIHINDKQLSVYSTKIAELILRSAIEIESIVKELYVKNAEGEIKSTDKLKFDYDILDGLLIPKWVLDKKVVVVSSPNCFLEQRELFPFIKENEAKTFSWNKAYQGLKHDRAKSIKSGNIKTLFNILAALYVLNLYYKDEKPIRLNEDSNGHNLSPNIGSEVFSINIARWGGMDGNGEIHKAHDYDKSVYYVRMTKETEKIVSESFAAWNRKINELGFQNPKVLEYLQKTPETERPRLWLMDALGTDFTKITQEAGRQCPPMLDKARYEAVLNRNQA